MAIVLESAGSPSAQASAGSNLTLNMPGTIQPGWFLISFVAASVVGPWSGTALNAAGFTQRVAYDSGGVSPAGACYWKAATGSEGATITATSPGGTSQGEVLAFSGVDLTNPFNVADVFDPHSTATGTYTVPAQTPTLTGAAALVHAFGNTNTGTWTGPSGYTQDLNVASPTPKSLVAHLTGLTGGVSTGSRTITVTSIRGTAAGFILQPAVALALPPTYRWLPHLAS